MRPELQERMLALLPTHHPRAELGEFYQMLRDYPSRGGKGIRAELLLQSARAYGASTAQWEQAMWLSAALELFQNWILIHDDIEDDSDERRGQPALHRLHGLPLALNVGDALHIYMWEAVQKAAVEGALGEFMSMIHRTAEGQHLDLCWVERGEWQLTYQDYLDMVQLKTAHYTMISPLRLGALAAGATPHPDFYAAGLALGTAFQIRDDVLNLIGDEAKYGKEIGGDLLEGKRTIITLHWLAHAPAEQKATFLHQMQLPRPQKSAQVHQQLLDWLRKSDSIQFAQQYAQQQAEQGLKLLQTALTDAPEQAAAQELLNIVRVLATRQA